MSIWVFIWIVLLVFVLGIFFWSMQILFKQKRAWKALANSLNLEYKNQAFLMSPIVDGRYNGYHITLYSEEQLTKDSSKRQFRTVLVMSFQEGFPTGGAVASAGRRPFVEDLKIEDVHSPDFKGWNGSVIFHTQNDKILSAFMNNDRYKALHHIMNLKGKESIFIFDDKEAYYRLETADPMVDPNIIQQMLSKLTKECDILRPNKSDKVLFSSKKEQLEEEPEEKVSKPEPKKEKAKKNKKET